MSKGGHCAVVLPSPCSTPPLVKEEDLPTEYPSKLEKNKICRDIAQGYSGFITSFLDYIILLRHTSLSFFVPVVAVPFREACFVFQRGKGEYMVGVVKAEYLPLQDASVLEV